MPGLIRGVARTAVVAGTATAVSNRVSRRQAGRWASQEQPPQEEQYQEEPPPQQQYVPEQRTAEPQVDVMDQLKKLGDLRDQGVLTEAEFQQQKAKLLNM